MSKYFILLLIIFFGNPAIGKGRLEAGIGVGLFDGLCVKAKYGKNLKLGISQGFASIINPTAIEIYYWLPKISNPAAPRRFYIMGGYSATLFAKGYDNFEKTYFYPRIGRSFIFSKKREKFGINLDAGVAVLRSTNPPEGYVTNFFPFSSSLSFFIRL